jgi:hypothetical protein
VSTDVSEEHIASILRVEKMGSARNPCEGRWRYVPPKRGLTLNVLHGVTSQKMVLFITTAVGTSNPKQHASLGEKEIWEDHLRDGKKV